MRTSSLTRETKETSIRASLTLDNEKGGLKGSTGVGFFDHMLNSFCVHGSFILEIEMSGDLYVDCHHTIEDVGIVLGKLFKAENKTRENLQMVIYLVPHVSGGAEDDCNLSIAWAEQDLWTLLAEFYGD